MGARPAVAVIDSLAAEGRQQDFLRSRTPVVAARRSTRAFRAPRGAKRRGAGASHIAALSVGRNDAVLADFDEVFDYYFNKLTQTRLLATRRGPHT